MGKTVGCQVLDARWQVPDFRCAVAATENPIPDTQHSCTNVTWLDGKGETESRQMGEDY